MNRSPPYYNGIMHHREWQGVSARWFVIKITPQSSLLKTDICGQRRQWTGGGWVRWLTGWQNHPIPGFVPQSRVQLHPRLTLGKPRPTLRQMNFGRFVGLGYNITTQILPARSGPQWRLEMIVAIRSTVQYTEIIGTVSRSTEVWREEPVISGEKNYNTNLLQIMLLIARRWIW